MSDADQSGYSGKYEPIEEVKQTFRVGDRVKIEGVLEANEDSDLFSLKLKMSPNNQYDYLTFTNLGEHHVMDMPCLQMVQKYVEKVAHYKVLYTDDRFGNTKTYISDNYYIDEKDFKKQNVNMNFMQLLESLRVYKELDKGE